MIPSEFKNCQTSKEQNKFISTTLEFLALMHAQEQINQQCEEGRAIADIVKNLGLSPAVIAAIHVYPLVRDNLLTKDQLEASNIGELTEIVHGLVQLGRFRLPPNWQPGEALAVQQSEALRKMLLSIVYNT